MYMGPKKEEFVSILNEISMSSGILTWWHLPALPSSEKSEYLEWEDRIYFCNKFSDYWNVGMPAKVSALISRNLWLLAWKMKENQPSVEPHSCGWTQSNVLTVIKGNKCATVWEVKVTHACHQLLSSSTIRIVFPQWVWIYPFPQCYPKKSENCTSWMLKIMPGNFTYLNLGPMCLFLLCLFLDGSNYVAQAGFEELLHQLLESWITGVYVVQLDHWA